LFLNLKPKPRKSGTKGNPGRDGAYGKRRRTTTLHTPSKAAYDATLKGRRKKEPKPSPKPLGGWVYAALKGESLGSLR